MDSDLSFAVLRSGSKGGDYRDHMNHANYKKWLQEKFILNLEPKSVIVVDNATSHKVQLNRHPTNNATSNNAQLNRHPTNNAR